MLTKKNLSIAIILMMLLTSCQAIGDIFQAGVWVGVLIVVVIIAILIAVFRKRS